MFQKVESYLPTHETPPLMAPSRGRLLRGRPPPPSPPPPSPNDLMYDARHCIPTPTGHIWHIRRKQYVTQHRTENGYLYVVDHAGRPHFVHRIVAKVFCPGENRLHVDADRRTRYRCIVDHIDSNRTNNDATNLRWVTNNENLRYAHHHRHTVKARAKGTGAVERSEE